MCSSEAPWAGLDSEQQLTGSHCRGAHLKALFLLLDACSAAGTDGIAALSASGMP